MSSIRKNHRLRRHIKIKILFVIYQPVKELVVQTVMPEHHRKRKTKILEEIYPKVKPFFWVKQELPHRKLRAFG
jgi:hypothetical protein